MAMLAGPRRRKRYNLTPRGKALYEDENNVGTKLLEKMGWTKGSGLGRNEHGATDFVRVNYKNDALGIGYTARDDQWTEHENKFNGLLQSLRGEEGSQNDENNMQNTDVEARTTVGFGFQNEVKKIKEKLREKVSGESLEEKSKNSKVRVHYKKFTKGKDIAQYSEKDLANIFGKKVEGETMNGICDGYQLPDNDCTAKEGEECGIQTKFAGVLTIKAGSSVDYFKQKMDAIKKKMRGTFDHEETRLVDEDPENCEKNETSEFSSLKTKKSKLKKQSKVDEAYKPLKSIDENSRNQLIEGEYAVEAEATRFCVNVEEKSKENVEAEKSTKQLKRCNKDENVEAGEPIEARHTTENDRLVGNDAKINEFVKKSESFLQSIKKKKKKAKKSHDAEVEEEQRLVVENPVLQLVEEEKSELSSKLPVAEKTKKKKQKRSNGGESVEAEESSKKMCKKRKNEDEVFLIQESFENDDAPKNTQSIETTDNENIKVQKKKSKKSQKKTKAELLESANEPKIIESETNSLINNGSSCQTIASDQVTNDMSLAPAERDAIIKNESTRIPNDVSETTDHAISSENEDAPKENCSLEDLIAKRESYNVYTISSFSAEKFSNADLDSYVGSNLQQIVGYGLSDELKLNVKVAKRDEERINQLWNCSSNKYKDANPKQIYKKYIKEAYTARRTKKKIPRLHVKSLKRKHVFSGF